MDSFVRFDLRARERRFWEMPFEDLSEAEQTFRTLWARKGEVDNGGFDPYPFNRSGDTAFTAVAVLERIGARNAARLVAAALETFPDGTPPRPRAERVAVIDALPDEERLRWQEREARFCEEPDDLEALLDAHAHRHASEIHGAGP